MTQFLLSYTVADTVNGKPYSFMRQIEITSITFDAEKSKFIAEYEWHGTDGYYPTTNSRRGISSSFDQALRNLRQAMETQPDWENDFEVET